jgi:hypothetical protein
MMSNLEVFKKDKNVVKFMKQYRYFYGKNMLNDLATLVQVAYLEGYNNGLGQHLLEAPDSPKPKEKHDR